MYKRFRKAYYYSPYGPPVLRFLVALLSIGKKEK
jgi:hypothetical protein